MFTCGLDLTGLARNVWGLSASSTGTLKLTSPVKRGLLMFTLDEACIESKNNKYQTLQVKLYLFLYIS